MNIDIRCTQCGNHNPTSPSRTTCDACGGTLEVVPGIPVTHKLIVSLGEGNTPIVRLSGIGELLGVNSIYGKLEFMNPTGSFKDRGSATLVSILKEHHIVNVAEDSSGNAGASIAAFCAKAEINATIFVPSSAPPSKLDQISFYGATIKKVNGGREAVTKACKNFCREENIVYASHNLSPYFLEGMKRFASEILTQLDPGPDHILFPVGNGSLLIGTWKGYRELATITDNIPRLHGIQSSACMPLVASFNRKNWQPKSGNVVTIAGGIAVENPPRKAECLQAMMDTGGTAHAITEEAIKFWQRALAEKEGLFVEPTSAAALAGVQPLVESGIILRDERILIPLTGSGLKDIIPSPPSGQL